MNLKWYNAATVWYVIFHIFVDMGVEFPPSAQGHSSQSSAWVNFPERLVRTQILGPTLWAYDSVGLHWCPCIRGLLSPFKPCPSISVNLILKFVTAYMFILTTSRCSSYLQGKEQVMGEDKISETDILSESRKEGEWNENHVNSSFHVLANLRTSWKPFVQPSFLLTDQLPWRWRVERRTEP